MGSTERLREVFQKILQSNLASLDQEVKTMLNYTLRHDALEQTEDPRDKVQEVLTMLLDRGEEASQGFWDNLSKNQHLFPGILQILNEPRTDKAIFKRVVEDLGLGKFLRHKLTLSDVQSITCDELSDASCHSVKDIPMHFLRHLMALNIHEAFRSFHFNHEAAQNSTEQDTSDNLSGSVHPLDVLCSLLHCSDNFLRQEIIRRMSMCQVPVPLLLPAGEDEHGTFLLWAMRGIMKSLSPGLIEDSVVNISLPVFSFVSLGECRCMPIARIINHILTADQQRNQNNVAHRVMSWGNIPRRISEGLVEISWHFPADQIDFTPFEKPFAITNLYGDLQSNMEQFYFLTKVSSAVFILIENMTKQQWDLLLPTGRNNKNYYFIVQEQFNQDCSRLFSEFGFDEQNVLIQSDKNFHQKLQFILQNTIQKFPKQMTLSEMSVVASKLNFCSDENQASCENGRLHSQDLFNNIVSAIKYNEGDAMQQHLKMQTTQTEKQLCQLNDQGGFATVDHTLTLTDEMVNLREAQNRYNQSVIMTNILYAFTNMNNIEQQYFLKWMQFQKLSKNAKSTEKRQEDMFYKMYEAEVFAGNIAETTRLCTNFPKAAADLLLQGIPIELIDGDTVSIQLQWITDVLTELDTKTKGKCRIRVITVLGVQGTGKSTLLNTMFGLQFPVAQTQCTRGAMMSLIRVQEKDLGCDFLVVIDCEGLRALDMASPKDSYYHDNELATLVVGLSDIVLINMALGSTSEMQNILQIVVHALLRMKGTGQKPNCLLVYHRMEGAYSEAETMIENKERLCLGAQIDTSSQFLKYNDTIECNILEDHWTIPQFDLKTSHYSEKIVELKRHLLQMVKCQSQTGSFRNVQSFASDINALWNSVKHENYIFRFKNILEVTVYTELYERFLGLERNLCRKMHMWWIYREEFISKQPGSELNILVDTLAKDVLRKLNEEVKMMEESLQVHFIDDSTETNSHIAKQFESQFVEKIKSLKSQLETHYINKCTQIKILRHGLANIIVEDFTQEQLDPDEANFDIECYWDEAVTKYQSMLLRYNVEEEFLQLLRQDMKTKGSLVTELIHSISSLSDYADRTFTYDERYINKSWFFKKCNHMENCLACHNKRESVTKFLLEKSNKYVQKMVESKIAYDRVHGMNLLDMVNEVIREDTMPYTVLFQLHLKLRILAQFALRFQQIHNDFINVCLDQYTVDHQRFDAINYLKCVLQDKRVAKNYCQNCLKPVVALKVKKLFQQKLLNDYTNHICAVLRSRRRPTEGSRGLKCIHHAPVEDTLEDIHHRYTDEEEIQVVLTNIMSLIIENIRKVLNYSDILKSGNIQNVMAAVWSVLQEGMSGVRGDISNASLNVTGSNVLLFASYLKFFVDKMEKQIQEEFCSKSIEEHYTECPYLIH